MQTQLAKKKNLASAHDESESNLSVGSDYEKKNDLNDVSHQVAQLTRPVENVLLFFAMCSYLTEIDDNEREIARRWVGRWNDKTRDYQMMIDRGREIANL